MAPINNAVFATLLTNDAYLPGAMVLAHSLKDRGAKGKLVALVVMDQLAGSTIADLQTVYDEIVPVPQITNPAPANLYLMDRPDLIATFTKIQLWKQTQYKRIVYIDADVVALRAPNELLTMDTEFAAAPDIGWPDCFNSGVMVLNPNLADYYALLALAERGISFDGADQGLLNMHYTEWERLSFKYNCTPSGNYQYVPAYRHFQSSISLVHFIGRDKPWVLGRSSRDISGVHGELVGRWWSVYDRHYRSRETVYFEGAYQPGPKKVQDYVRGEETTYLPSYQAPPSMPHSAPTGQGQHAMPSAPSAEQPFGDPPTVEEQIRNKEFEPTPTVQQRRWSAPHTEWEPSKAPPPVNSKPEASNFPSQVYDFSEDVKLFRPPARYPEAPKGMWYEVPENLPPPSKPKPIFPWEERTPRPTRVFLEPALFSPPMPEPMAPAALSAGPDPNPNPNPDSSNPDPSYDPAPSAVPQLGHDAKAPEVTPSSRSAAQAGAAVSDGTDPVKEPWTNPWETFNQRTNAWDDMPEIVRYVQALSPPKRGAIQVLHHTPSTSIGGIGDLGSALNRSDRRPSLRITDFPTATERPSLPVTPAPIRRPTFWGEEKDLAGELPTAEGVPKQDEWNPISKLEELQRRQSEILLGRDDVEHLKQAPKRNLPDSASKEAVEAAVERTHSPTSTRHLKPILKEPKFELAKEPDEPDVAGTGRTFHDIVTDDALSPTDTHENMTDPVVPPARVTV